MADTQKDQHAGSPEFAPVRTQISVDVPQERAFRVFTENFDGWWPRSHHVAKAEMKRAVLEPRVGGRWYEIGVDGSECNWGTVLVWEPPRRLVLAWQIDAEFRYDPKLVTEVEVRFEVEGPKLTRVELEHRKLERFGETIRKVKPAISGSGGWPGLLALFAKQANAAQ